MMFKDLSIYNRPISTFFEDSADTSQISLTNEQIEFYVENGYLAGLRVLTEEQIDLLRRELTVLMRPGQESNQLFYEYNRNESADNLRVLFHALGAWRVSTAFHDLLFHKAFTVPAGQLLGGSVRFWHDQVFVKPANDGGFVAWHQDYSYWTRTKPVAHITCWIGLDDSTRENGCVHYVPGTHKWDLLPRDSLADDMDAVYTRLSDEQREHFKPVAIELKAGEASFHHPMVIHGSYENRTDRPRRAIVINAIRDGVVSDTDAPLLEGVPSIKKGNKLEGQFFPLLS